MSSAIIVFRSCHDNITETSGKLWFSHDGMPSVGGRTLAYFLGGVEMVTAQYKGFNKFSRMDQLVTNFIIRTHCMRKGPWVTEATEFSGFDYVYTVTWRYTSSDVYAYMTTLEKTGGIGVFEVSVNGGKDMSLNEFINFCQQI